MGNREFGRIKDPPVGILISSYLSYVFPSQPTMASLDFSLYTDRLLIRPFVMSDAEELHRIFGDPEVMGRIPGGPSKNLGETRKRLRRIIEDQEKNGHGLWAVLRKEDGRLIGNCGIIQVEGKGPEVELSYDFGREFWGKGYATEAARECLRFGFKELGLKRIIAITYPDHLASRRVMEKSGMTFQGAGRYYNDDMVVYAISREKAPGA